MSKATEVRDMSDEQIRLTWKEAAENLFRLRIKSQTERIEVPTELRKSRRLIARCQTILHERELAAAAKAASEAKPGTDAKAAAAAKPAAPTKSTAPAKSKKAAKPEKAAAK
jgi:large subunit ribosomal protein L29